MIDKKVAAGSAYKDAAVNGYPYIYVNLPGALIRRLQQRMALALTTRFAENGADLTPVQYSVLAAICTNPSIEQGMLADVIGYDRATVGGVIDRLEQKFLVQRNLSPADRRVRLLTIAPSGIKLLKRASSGILAAQDDILEPLDPEERKQFTALLEKLVLGQSGK